MQHKITRLRVPSREGLALLFAMLLVLLVAILSYRAWAAFRRHTEELEVTQQIATGTNALLSSLKDAETGQRGFLLTGEDRYLEPYRQALADIPKLLQSLDAVALAHPEQAERVVKLKPLVNQRLASLERNIELRRSKGIEAALDAVRTDRGKMIMDQVRGICAEIQTVANRRAAQYSQEARTSASDLGLVATLGSACLLVLLLMATITIQTGIERRQQLIQDLQESEQRTRESRDWLQTTLSSIGDGVIATDANGKVTFLNAVAQALTGWTQEDATGKAIEQIFAIDNEDTGAVVENPVGRALREGRIVGLANHTRLTARDGRQMPIDDSAAPIRDDRGEVKGSVLVFRDVSQRRKAEAELKQSAERVRAILDANPIGVVAGDIHGGVHEANDAFLALTGYTREELVKGTVNWKAVTPPEYLPLDAHAAAEAQEKGVCTPYEKEYIRKDGSRVPVYIGFALLGESREETVAFILDLTDRKRAEEKLTQQIRRLVESNIVGIFVANKKRVIEANDLYLAMLGCSREDLIEGRVDWMKATPPDSLDRDMAGLQELRERGFCKPFEKEYIGHNGARIPVLMGSAVLTREPELTWISFVVDLTAQKGLERELRLANQRLSNTNEELQSFAYVAAHDLKSPLRTISSMTTLLVRQIEGQLDGESKQLAGFIESGVAQMSRLISDLLEVSKVASDVEKTEPVDCAALVASTVMNLQSQIRATGATVTCDPLPVVQAGAQLVQVFQNVIENALKYRSEKPPEIHVSAQRSGGEWILSVRDNGIGFEMQYAERIFGMFQRLHGFGKYEGTGIGLAISKKAVERYGGRIWVESEPGAGSTFYFSLPAPAEVTGSGSITEVAGA